MTLNPVTATLSVAVKVVIETVSAEEAAGIVKPVTVGAIVSVGGGGGGGGGSVIVTLALLLADTLPAASLAQA